MPYVARMPMLFLTIRRCRDLRTVVVPFAGSSSAKLIAAAAAVAIQPLKRCRTVFWLKTLSTFSSNLTRLRRRAISCESKRSVVDSIGVRPGRRGPREDTVSDGSDVGRHRRAAADILIQANLRPNGAI